MSSMSMKAKKTLKDRNISQLGHCAKCNVHSLGHHLHNWRKRRLILGKLKQRSRLHGSNCVRSIGLTTNHDCARKLNSKGRLGHERLVRGGRGAEAEHGRLRKVVGDPFGLENVRGSHV